MPGSFLTDLLLSVSDRGRALLGRGERPTGPEALIDRCEALLGRRGEATGMAMARDILEGYDGLDPAGRMAFFQALASRFGADPEPMRRAIAAWQADPSGDQATALHFASEPRRQELFRRLNRAPGGMAALVRMRAGLLEMLADWPELKATDRDFHHLFSSWFNRGFLVLRRIDWSTPANILDKIIRYEAVHEIGDWNDLRRRIDPPDRRCYGFFHPALADEPLIFVEVALTREMPAAIEPVLAPDRAPLTAAASTAVFYSISNCQRGLHGVSFGPFLIKQVVDSLVRDQPSLDSFVTLSPAPGFVEWLKRLAAGDEALAEPARTACQGLEAEAWRRVPDGLREVLMPLAAHYFLAAKNRRGESVDPVARFHLGNGARLERLNWRGDETEKGIAQSAGVMVNYRYDLAHLERNHEAYANQGEVVAAGAVTRLAKARVVA